MILFPSKTNYGYHLEKNLNTKQHIKIQISLFEKLN